MIKTNLLFILLAEFFNCLHFDSMKDKFSKNKKSKLIL